MGTISGFPALDERLSLIAAQVRKGSVVADIGSDHGYLITWLVLRGICPQGIAADIHAMPLDRSRRTVQDYGVADRIRLVLGDGLEGLAETEADDIIIAGMGGDLIAKILQTAHWHSREKRWLLQPMTRAAELRRWLCGNGYEIAEEHAAHSGHFYYTVMTVQYTGKVTHCDDLFAIVGRLPGQTTPAAAGYLRWQARVLAEKAAGLARSTAHREEAETWLRLSKRILSQVCPSPQCLEQSNCVQQESH